MVGQGRSKQPQGWSRPEPVLPVRCCTGALELAQPEDHARQGTGGHRCDHHDHFPDPGGQSQSQHGELYHALGEAPDQGPVGAFLRHAHMIQLVGDGSEHRCRHERPRQERVVPGHAHA
ncbi:hypothetical protein D9M69_612580 [compost metagenome]